MKIKTKPSLILFCVCVVFSFIVLIKHNPEFPALKPAAVISDENTKYYYENGEMYKVTFPIDVNLASQKELEQVPGLTAAQAAEIIKWRTTFGKFKKIENLARLDNITREQAESWREYLYC